MEKKPHQRDLKMYEKRPRHIWKKITKRDLMFLREPSTVLERAMCARVCICVPTQLIMPNLPCVYITLSKETYIYAKETYISAPYARESTSVCPSG